MTPVLNSLYRGTIVALTLLVGLDCWAQSSSAGERSRRTRSLSLAEQVWMQVSLGGAEQVALDDAVAEIRRWFNRMDPGGAGSISQNEFLSRFGLALNRVQTSSRRRFGFSLNRYLGLFVVVDGNHDRRLTSEELSAAFESLLAAAVDPASETLAKAAFIKALEARLPRTNLTGVGVVTDRGRPEHIPDAPESPVLSPTESRDAMQFVPGFKAVLAAMEPLIEDPIAMTFDAEGRLYVVELNSFMQDIKGTNENAPISRIKQLQDQDGDGVFDRANSFLEDLRLPRSALAIQGGLLYVANHQLHFARDDDQDGKADVNELVDSEYGRGSIEHAPNGLMLAMDNWIYNARSPFRYRLIGNHLVREETEFRGQWGMTQDDRGRLFYNINNSQLLGDFSPPNYLGRNPNYPSRAGLNLYVATDQRVFPIRMNTAVNRGYLPEVLDEQGRLHVFASSCSPVIYRGDQYGSDYLGNAFVCGPGANLVKRNLVFAEGMTLTSRFAYPDREFLASADERFRPISLTNGPDGNLWLLDMYRGVIQQGLYMTRYLREESVRRGLDQGIGLGRLYRLLRTDKPQVPTRVNLNPDHPTSLIQALGHPNGWVRDQAQRLLVQGHDCKIVPALIKKANEAIDWRTILHCLWTVEGIGLEVKSSEQGSGGIRLHVLDDTRSSLRGRQESEFDAAFAAILELIGARAPQVQTAAMRVAESLAWQHDGRARKLASRLLEVAASFPQEVRFQALLSAGALKKPEVFPVMLSLLRGAEENYLLREATLSGLGAWELGFLQALGTDHSYREATPGRRALIVSLASAVMRDGKETSSRLILSLLADHLARKNWQGTPVLVGLGEGIRQRRGRAIRFTSEPREWQRLASLLDSNADETMQQIFEGLTWPGHPHEQVVESAEEQRTVAQSVNHAGEELYQTVCAGCHGLEGEGVRPMAPPLADSAWVTGDLERFVRIILHGMQGPVTVAGQTYQVPDILPEMPPLAVLDNAQIADVANWVRNRWGNIDEPIAPERVGAVRQDTEGRETPWTAVELLR